MVKRTLAQVKERLAQVMGEAGMAATDPRLVNRINDAVEELVNEGDWPGVVDRYKFTVYNGTFTLPADLERAMGLCTFQDGSWFRHESMAPWYEFMSFGPGPMAENADIPFVLDRDNTPTLNEIPEASGPWYLEVYGQVDERVAGVRPTVIVQGYDAAGDRVFSQVDGEWVDGEKIEINGDSPPKKVRSISTFSRITGVIKPETSAGVVVWANNGTQSLLVGRYAPRETVPSYRRYYIPSLVNESLTTDQDPVTVLVRARKRFYPVSRDEDIMLIGNVPALRAMLIAQQKLSNDKTKEYLTNKAIAIDILKNELMAYRGKNPQPAISFGRDFAIGSFPAVI